MDEFEFKDGDVILTYGTFHVESLKELPKELAMQLAYWGIRKYQKNKWAHIWDLDYRMTHVRLFLDGKLFEVTMPHAMWSEVEDCNLDKKKFKVCRWPADLDKQAMVEVANKLDGTKYDLLDLGGFAVSGILGVFADRINVLHDRIDKFKVCSTGAAEILSAGGAIFDGDLKSIDPAYYGVKFPVVFEYDAKA